MTTPLPRPRRSSLASATQATVNITGKRYCSHHQGEALVEQGSFVLRNKTKRWICFSCQEKSKNSRPQSDA